MGKKSFLIFKYALNIGKNDAERISYNNSGNNSISSKPLYTGIIDSLSNHFLFNTINNAGSINYRFVEKKYNWALGSGFGTAHYQLNDMAKNTIRSVNFNNFIPAFTFNYNPKQQRRLKFEYAGNTINPTLLQIQPIIDNTDPLNINIGNANLQQGFTNTVRADYVIKKKASDTGKSEDEVMKELVAEIPVGRIGEPQEFGAAVAFLCSPAAAYINGINLPVDGGRTGCL
jgi:hypothetical protein